jgi:Pyruvate/2-oxoacid:ferredoxin oxidoreductase delta subunit
MSVAFKLSRTQMFKEVEELENALHDRNDVIHPDERSPERFEIVKGLMKRKKGGPPWQMLPIMLPTLSGIKKSLRSIEDNPSPPNHLGTPEVFKELENLAIQSGASSVGYTKVPSRWVFQNKAIAYGNAIVLSMEMDEDGISSAPSLACMKTVMETYRDLGKIANKLAARLRKLGYGAHAGHPLNGMALYPPLAQMAGLGWMGLNGIIITPEFGPRVRLAAVFTSIENLPFSNQNEHVWVADYCETCKICLKKCPPQALYDHPKDHGNGQITYVENDLCFPYFSDNYGCSVCVAVCPFNLVPYEKIRQGYVGKEQA